jgi:hypothetical protein
MTKSLSEDFTDMEQQSNPSYYASMLDPEAELEAQWAREKALEERLQREEEEAIKAAAAEWAECLLQEGKVLLAQALEEKTVAEHKAEAEATTATARLAMASKSKKARIEAEVALAAAHAQYNAEGLQAVMFENAIRKLQEAVDEGSIEAEAELEEARTMAAEAHALAHETARLDDVLGDFLATGSGTATIDDSDRGCVLSVLLLALVLNGDVNRTEMKLWRSACEAAGPKVAVYRPARVEYLCDRFRNFEMFTAKDVRECFEPAAKLIVPIKSRVSSFRWKITRFLL